MRHRRIQVAAAVAIVSIVSVVATTALAGNGGRNFEVELTGFEEVPAVSTVASGEFEARINRSEQRVDYRLSYEDLEAPVLFAHIHIGQKDVNGGVTVFLCGGGTKPAPCPQSGTVEDSFGPSDVTSSPGATAQGIAAGEFDELIRAMRAGVTYANVHSQKFPGGEVRGQINDDRDDDD
jgi:CHRD domain